MAAARSPSTEGAEGDEPLFRWGIDLFIENGAYTSVTAAVTILVVLTLLFSSVTAVWSLARAADVQASADITAMAGANVVSSYCTVATTIDACIATLGFAGIVTTGVGLVATIGSAGAATPVSGNVLNVGTKLINARNKFAESASKGLQAIEKALPFLVGVNGLRICSAQSVDGLAYTGAAVAVPWTSASDFTALSDGKVETDDLEEAGEDLEDVSDELEDARQKTADAKKRAWLADCGSTGRNMRERASKLSGLTAAENPDYASSLTWTPQVGLNRARAYYRWRRDHEQPNNDSVEEKANSAARRAYYEYAYQQLSSASITEVGDTVTSTLKLLPKNTSEVKKTTLYTDVVWPSSLESDGLTLHYASDCPGATGAPGSLLALSAIDTGAARECPTCKFGVGDVGKTPAASTSIDNGFEYHLREFTLALDDYVAARNEELELETQAEDEADEAGNIFEQAMDYLASKRPKIAPPGRYGCVAFAVSGEIDSSSAFDTTFAPSVTMGSRGAIAAAALAPDDATFQNNVLSSFFSSLESRVQGNLFVGLIGGVMDLWGTLLVAYGNAGNFLSTLLDQLVAGADKVGLGFLVGFLRDRLVDAVEGLGLEPVDLRLKKPVLTDTSNVLERSDIPGLSKAQDVLRAIPLGSSDPTQVLESVGCEVLEAIDSYEFTVAEIELPFGGTIPLTIRLQDVVGFVGAGDDGQ